MPRYEVLATEGTEEAVRAVVWVDRMVTSRFAALMHLWQGGMIPHCVNCCGDLHNFVDWNVAGEAEPLLEAAEQALGDPAAGLYWACRIFSAADELIGWWLAGHAVADLPADATLEQMAGLLCSHNLHIEEQVAERFLRLDHEQVRQFLRHAAGHDGSNMGVKVMALAKVAYRAGQACGA